MIRIDVVDQTPQHVTLQASGRLSEAEAAIFETELSRWVHQKKRSSWI